MDPIKPEEDRVLSGETPAHRKCYEAELGESQPKED
jgi:hypothetical protein